MSTKPDQNTSCMIHGGRKEIALCLNEKCFKKNNCCSICLFETHKGCPVEFTYLFKEIHSNIIIDNQIENFEMGKDLIEFLKERKTYFINNFDKLISDVEQTFNPVSYQDLLTPAKLDVIKRISDIKFDQQSNKVVITPFPRINKWELNDFIKRFKAKLSDDNLIGFTEFKISKDNWMSHWSMDLEITPTDTGTLITKAKANWDTDDFVSKAGSLISHCKYKITVNNIVEYKRALFIGVAPESELDRISEKFYCYYFQETSDEVLDFNCFSGLDTKNMKGKFDDQGFTVERSYYLEFIPNRKVRIYDDTGEISVVGSVENSDEPYFMFMYLGEDPVSVFIERLF